MSSDQTFLESLIRQSSLNPKGTIMGNSHKVVDANSIQKMPWDFEISNEDEEINEDSNEDEEINESYISNASLAMKLNEASRKLSNLIMKKN
jgi:hypothetical protein